MSEVASSSADEGSRTHIRRLSRGSVGGGAPRRTSRLQRSGSKDASGARQYCTVVVEAVWIEAEGHLKGRRRVEYRVEIRHLRSGNVLTFQRKFMAFRQFQKEVLRCLDPGHRCIGCCPYLYFAAAGDIMKNPIHGLLAKYMDKIVYSRARLLQKFLQGQIDLMSVDDFSHCSLSKNVQQCVRKFLTQDQLLKKNALDSFEFLQEREMFIPVRKSSSGSGAQITREILLPKGCGICGDEVNLDFVSTLACCGALFHDSCLLDHVALKKHCPNCRNTF